MTKYDTAFYDMQEPGAYDSASVVAPIITELVWNFVRGHRVIDVGCGAGAWARAFGENGWSVLGVDGEYARDRAQANGIAFEAWDLNEPLAPKATGRRWDVAVCLEVAEHLQPERTEDFLRELSALAPTVLFSGAIPGQGGVGHINERWTTEWASMLREFGGYRVSGALRFIVWDDVRVENWYRQNILFATVDPRVAEALDARVARHVHRPLDLVHPVLFDHVHFRNHHR